VVKSKHTRVKLITTMDVAIPPSTGVESEVLRYTKKIFFSNNTALISGRVVVELSRGAEASAGGALQAEKILTLISGIA
jgi:hypothetical protein